MDIYLHVMNCKYLLFYFLSVLAPEEKRRHEAMASGKTSTFQTDKSL